MTLLSPQLYLQFELSFEKSLALFFFFSSLIQMHDFVVKSNEYLTYFYAVLKWDDTVPAIMWVACIRCFIRNYVPSFSGYKIFGYWSPGYLCSFFSFSSQEVRISVISGITYFFFFFSKRMPFLIIIYRSNFY